MNTALVFLFLMPGAIAFCYMAIVVIIGWRFNRVSSEERGQREGLKLWSTQPSDNVALLLYVVRSKPQDKTLRVLTLAAKILLAAGLPTFIICLVLTFLPRILYGAA